MAKDKPKGMPAKGDTKATAAIDEAARKVNLADTANPDLSDDDEDGPSVGGSSANRVPTASTSADASPSPRQSGEFSPPGSPRSLDREETDDEGTIPIPSPLGFTAERPSTAGGGSGKKKSPADNNPRLTEEALARFMAAQQEGFRTTSKSGDEVSEAGTDRSWETNSSNTDRADSVSEPDDDTRDVRSDTSEKQSAPKKTRADSVKSLLFDMAGRLSDVSSNLLGNKTTDEEWSNIRKNIVESATQSGFKARTSKNKKEMIILDKNDKKCIFITREKDTSLTFSAKGATTAYQLAEIFAASGKTECTISKAKTTKMAAELYFELTNRGITVHIPANILDRMRKDGSAECQRALAEYLSKNPDQRTAAEKAAAQRAPSAPTANGTGSRVPVPPEGPTPPNNKPKI